jgi:hypothetical protein
MRALWVLVFLTALASAGYQFDARTQVLSRFTGGLSIWAGLLTILITLLIVSGTVAASFSAFHGMWAVGSMVVMAILCGPGQLARGVGFVWVWCTDAAHRFGRAVMVLVADLARQAVNWLITRHPGWGISPRAPAPDRRPLLHELLDGGDEPPTSGEPELVINDGDGLANTTSVNSLDGMIVIREPVLDNEAGPATVPANGNGASDGQRYPSNF